MTKFAHPTERDLRFVRNSGFKQEDFGEEIRLSNSIVSASIIIAALLTALAALALLS
jgi:hypothetical protein